MSKITKPPDLKSVAAAKGKAAQYVSSKETNSLVKKAILEELNSHFLSIKPEKIHRASGKGRGKIHGRIADDRNPYHEDSAFVKKKDAKTFVERHGEIASNEMANASKIPRPIGRTLEKYEKDKKLSRAKKDASPTNIPDYDWNKKGRVVELKTR
eukprot:gene11896-2450_t